MKKPDHLHKIFDTTSLRELGIQLIPAYSPQARGRSERSFRTWQGRLPQELRLRNLTTPEEANRSLKRSYIRQFNLRFTHQSAEPRESAFVPCTRADLDRVFSIQTERTVNRDNTVKFNNMFLQIDKQGWRSSMEGCRVIVYQHFDDTITIGYGHQQLGKYSADGLPIKPMAKISDRLELKRARPFSSKHSNRTYNVLDKPDIFSC